MIWPFRKSGPDEQRRELSRHLRKLQQLFPVQDILGERLDARRVQDYYRECHDAYRKHHSSEGSTHLALNADGRFHPDGFYGQLRRIEARWAGQPPADVLELGFGQGFNLDYLASRHPGTRFHGVDLSPDHMTLAQARLSAVPNVQLRLGDMHQLPLADGSVDEVFAVEAFCYASDMRRALGEVARVLRPGGRMTVFDVYQCAPTEALDADSALAVQLVARGMSLERWPLLAELQDNAHAQGLVMEKAEVLNGLVLPNLRRLQRVVGAVVRLPWLARRALASRAPERSRNVMSGLLMYPTISMHTLLYEEVVLRKAAA